MPDDDHLLLDVSESILAAAQTINIAGSEVSRAIRNLDNTIKAANGAARDIKIAGIWLSGAIAFLTIVQIVIQFE